MCSMMNRGTKYADTSTSGRRAIGAVVTVRASVALNPPVPTATRRSKTPNRFQTIYAQLDASAGLSVILNATQGAASATAISPKPAGQANRPDRMPCAYRARKPRRQTSRPVYRS